MHRALLGVVPLSCLLGIAACTTENQDEPPPTGTLGADAGRDDAASVTDGGGTTDSGEPTDGGADAEPQVPAIRYIGRFETSDPAGPKVAWPGARVIVRFSGTELKVKTVETPSGGTSHYDVIVDGNVQNTPFKPANGAGNATVASGLAAGAHTVELYRRTEALIGVTQFTGFEYPNGGSLLPPPTAAARRIEFIGDSSTTGYGVECANSGQTFSDATENERKTYPSLAAKALGAEHHNISFSGKGVARNYDQGDADVMALLYARTLPETAASQWAFNSWTPDVVWIALGGNDWSADTSPPSLATFKTKYTELVNLVRAKYPQARIIGSVAAAMSDFYPAGNNAYTNLKTAIADVVKAKNDAGDTKVYAHELPRADQSGANGAPDLTGCAYHSNAAFHQKLALDVAAKVKAVAGW